MEQPSKQLKSGGSALDKAKPDNGDQARMDKQVVKAVLASPLIVPWPNIPAHLQKTLLLSLPKLIPDSIAAYHVDRARCHTKSQRQKRREKHAAKLVAESVTSGEPAEKEGMDVDSVEDTADTAVRRPKQPQSECASSRQPPEVLQHLVFGINETIKSLERSIDDLKMRLMIMADALSGTIKPALQVDSDGLLPTAPTDPEESPAITLNPAPVLVTPVPPAFIVIPLQSISPQSLVSAIPQYCATYNALVYQWGQLRKHVEAKWKGGYQMVVGEPREEVRLVPLGDVEAEMAKLVGLRRLACVAIRTSHPSLQVLTDLLPKSVLQPPRHKITLPYVTSSLAVHSGGKRKRAQTEPVESNLDTGALLPDVHYAPLTIKGITTTAPVDGQARKAKRLEEVRARRKEVKERTRQERLKEMKRGLKGEKPKRHTDKLAKRLKAKPKQTAR